MTAFDELYSDWQGGSFPRRSSNRRSAPKGLVANDVPITREQFKQALRKVQLALRGVNVEFDLRGVSREGEPPASQNAVDFASVSLMIAILLERHFCAESTARDLEDLIRRAIRELEQM
jgi:hypothetical protein